LYKFNNFNPKTNLKESEIQNSEMHSNIKIDENFSIDFKGWKNLLQILDFALLDQIKIPKECHAEAYFNDSKEFKNLEES